MIVLIILFFVVLAIVMLWSGFDPIMKEPWDWPTKE